MERIFAAWTGVTCVSIREFQQTNASRAARWHGDIHSWSVLEWAGALCGEAGEAANVAKKLRRLEQGLPGNQFSEHPDTDSVTLRFKLGEECADVLAYLVLLAEVYDIDLESFAIRKFNRISEQHGFPERL